MERSRFLVTAVPVAHRFSFREANQLTLGLKKIFLNLSLAVPGLCCCASLSVAVAHGLSRSVACGLFLGQGSKLSLALAGRFFTAEPLGRPWTPAGADDPRPCWTAGGLRVDEGRPLAHSCTSGQGVSSAQPGSERRAGSRR